MRALRRVYDGVTTTNPSKFDIDHVVPLGEAWVSGARKWTTAKRTTYANDLGYAWSLDAVTAHSNRSKGDRDPRIGCLRRTTARTPCTGWRSSTGGGSRSTGPRRPTYGAASPPRPGGTWGL
jgi:hypothetical protein